MSKHGSNYLIEQLLNNKLSEGELDEFLAGLHNEDDRKAYSDVLEAFFNELINQPEHPPDADVPTD